jgi:hypothetical protein
MKRRKNFLKEASVLLIAISMILSTIVVTSGTVIFSQLPVLEDDPASGGYSDANQGTPPFKVYENFWGLCDDITDVHWWGVFHEGSNQPTPGDGFEISFCVDDGGIPDYNNPIAVFTGSLGVEISYIGTGDFFFGAELIYMEMDLPTPVSMSSGWVSFFKTTINAQRFSIIDAQTGDGKFYHQNAADPDIHRDFAFELTTTESEPSVYVDIKPGSCPNPLNSKSKGLLPVAICGTPDFDVMDIDPATILLAGVPPIRFAYEDVATPFMGDLCDCHELNGDGYMDLTLKFKTQDIVAIIGTTTDREWRTLTLTGNLIGGELFEGQDCVWIVHERGSIL